MINKGYSYRRAEPCTDVATQQSRSLRRLSAAELRGIKPFGSSLARPCPCKHGRGLAPFVNKKLAILVICLLGFIPELYAQAFNPINGTAYPIEFVEWIINGEDRLSALQSNVRSCTITFNSENTVVSFGNIMYKATYTFFPDGRCEVSIKAIFIQRTVLGIGRVERSGRDFTLSLSMRIEAEDIVTMIKGSIK